MCKSWFIVSMGNDCYLLPNAKSRWDGGQYNSQCLPASQYRRAERKKPSTPLTNSFDNYSCTNNSRPAGSCTPSWALGFLFGLPSPISYFLLSFRSTCLWSLQLLRTQPWTDVMSWDEVYHSDVEIVSHLKLVTYAGPSRRCYDVLKILTYLNIFLGVVCHNLQCPGQFGNSGRPRQDMILACGRTVAGESERHAW